MAAILNHRPLVPLYGALIGCAKCWRVVGFRCGDVTFAGRNPCRPNAEITALAEHYWQRLRAPGTGSADVERIVSEFREALKGQGRHAVVSGVSNGGRHASGD